MTFTETSLETPASFIVTPERMSAYSIVDLLCVININCTVWDISFTTLQNLLLLASSKGASTSSSKQKGAGLILKIEKTKAMPTPAYSTPDNKFILSYNSDAAYSSDSDEDRKKAQGLKI